MLSGLAEECFLYVRGARPAGLSVEPSSICANVINDAGEHISQQMGGGGRWHREHPAESSRQQSV